VFWTRSTESTNWRSTNGMPACKGWIAVVQAWRNDRMHRQRRITSVATGRRIWRGRWNKMVYLLQKLDTATMRATCRFMVSSESNWTLMSHAKRSVAWSVQHRPALNNRGGCKHVLHVTQTRSAPYCWYLIVDEGLQMSAEEFDRCTPTESRSLSR